ncbi:DUF1249 domain-containing protein [Rheinheimera riviphila]|uniref:DUF1249 domain-containing protein n=1 Tax=Rheinheimera riviphila TaxID=1834037 RepID=A0A437QF52_9GAMM|nr:DUF1249 domain-containing protein [Rheinheimera riviphila]RVU33156.1 DUF1249 domain-containing protein [Rheinheimera riviphila]
MTLLAKKRSYKPYVPDFLTLCERNYAQLRFFLPGAAAAHSDIAAKMTAGASKVIQINEYEGYRIKLLELCKFTTTIKIEHVSDTALGWLRPQFEVRLYHDARLAEVVSCQQVRRFKAVYDYPNLEMMQPDEKRQINLLLRDWLMLCQRQGYHSVESLS